MHLIKKPILDGKFLELDHLRFEVKNQILHFTFIGPLEVKAKHITSFQKSRLQFLDGAVLPTIVNIEGKFIFTREARTALRKTQLEGAAFAAIVIKSPLQKLMVNIYLKLAQIEIEIKLFRSQKEGLKWLKSQMS